MYNVGDRVYISDVGETNNVSGIGIIEAIEPNYFKVRVIMVDANKPPVVQRLLGTMVGRNISHIKPAQCSIEDGEITRA